MVDLTPKRHADETFEQYKQRRASGNAAVKRYLRGRIAHESCRVVTAPLDDEEATKAAAKGLLRPTGIERVTANTTLAVYITKGVSFVREAE